MRAALSVIIPTLNEEDYLPLLLTDLTKQTNKNFEVIIVDAQSDDQTKARANKFKDSLNVRFMQLPRNGVSFQRNYGAEQAKSEYLFFLDADSRIKNDVMERVVDHIKQEKKLLYLPVVESSNPGFIYRVLTTFSTYAVMGLQMIGKPLSLGPNMVIQKKLFERIGGFDTSYAIAEDHNLVINAHKNGVKATFLFDVRCIFSMRRLEREGLISVLWRYLHFTLITLFRDGVRTTHHEYKMGGHHYKKAPVTE